MTKKRSIKVSIVPSLNRANIMTVHLNKYPINFTLLYNLKSPNLQIQYNSDLEKIQNKEIDIRIIRNLDKSTFCKSFLMLNNESNADNDFRCKFKDIKTRASNFLYQFLGEKYILNSNKNGSNNIMINAWKIFGFENDYIFYFVQRHIHMNDLGKNIIRTCALEIYNPNKIDKINDYMNNLNKNSKSNKKEELEDMFKNFETGEK